MGAYSPGSGDRRVDESWPTHGWPAAAYSREKAYLERVLDTFEREHMSCRLVRLRPGCVFKRNAAEEQRRLFAGPLLPGSIVRPGLIPVVPGPAALRLQAVHSLDVGEAFRLAATGSVRGAFNIAAEPVLDVRALAGLLGARTVPVPARPVRGLLAAAWHLHLVPASPDLFDLVLRLPLMDTTRAAAELGWTPRYSSLDAMREFLEGLRAGTGMDTPPLAPGAGGPMRIRELVGRSGRRQ